MLTDEFPDNKIFFLSCQGFTLELISMTKIAIPTENELLCSHFGHCKEFSIIETDGQKIIKEEKIAAPPHEPGLLPKWLAERNVSNVIAGSIGQRAVALFNQQNIQVDVGAEIKAPKQLVEDWLKGALSTGANACDH